MEKRFKNLLRGEEKPTLLFAKKTRCHLEGRQDLLAREIADEAQPAGGRGQE